MSSHVHPFCELHCRQTPRSDRCVCRQADSVFSGISTFGRLPYHPCLTDGHASYDIALIGPLRVHTHTYTHVV